MISEINGIKSDIESFDPYDKGISDAYLPEAKNL
jgi:hypothetical protein